VSVVCGKDIVPVNGEKESMEEEEWKIYQFEK